MDSDLDDDDDDAVMDVQEQDEGAKDTVSISARPPPRATRAKRRASVRRVNYKVSSEDSEKSEEDDDSDEKQEDDDQDGVTDDGDEGDGREQLDNKDEDMEMEEEEDITAKGHKENASVAKRTRKKDDPEEDSSHSASTARSKRNMIGKPRKPVEDSDSDSDSEFEPPAKAVLKVKTRGKGNDKKAASPSVEPAPKRPRGSSLQGKRQPGETETVERSKSLEPSDESRPAFAASGASSAVVSTASTPASNTDGTTVTSAGSTKVKKKRKLLTGKGLEELGDILNGPGSSLSSGPSTGLVFSKGNIRPRTTNHSGTGNGESSLMNGAGPGAVKLDALNAIKMAFTLPKPRNPSPG